MRRTVPAGGPLGGGAAGARLSARFELGELRRVEQGVAPPWRECDNPSAPAPDEGRGCRDRHEAPDDGDQGDARCGYGRRRAALATGGIEATHRPRDGGLRQLHDLRDRSLGSRHHGVRHEAADDDGRDECRQTDPPPRGHGLKRTGAG